MSLGDAIQRGLATEAEEKNTTAEADDKHATRAHYFENVSGFAHKAARATANVAGDIATKLSEGMRAQGEVAKQNSEIATQGAQDIDVAAAHEGKEAIVGGPGGEYARQMMKTDSPEQEANLEKMGGIYSKGFRQVPEYLAGGLEQALWGKVTGPIGNKLKPLTRFLPKDVAPVITDALVNGSLSGGAAALSDKIKGEKIHNIAEPFALGALIGGLAGYLSPEESQTVANNINTIIPAAGSYQSGLREVGKVAQRIGRIDRIEPQKMAQQIARFATGNGDAALAARLRMLGEDEPELFQSPLMKRVLASAKSADAGKSKPAVTLPRNGEITALFNMPKETGRTVMRAGGPTVGTRGPLGVPLEVKEAPKLSPKSGKVETTIKIGNKTTTFKSDDVRKHLETLMKWDPEKDSDNVSDDITNARKTISNLALAGVLKPEHIDLAEHATRIARAVARTGREEEKTGKPFTPYLDNLKEWMRRGRELNAKVELEPGKVDDTTSLVEAKEALDKGEPRETASAGPSKKRLTKDFKAKRDARGRFC